MKEMIFQKLMSRKLWIAIIGIIVGLATAFGIQENDYAQIAGVVGSICSGVVYILGEAKIDATNKVTYIETSYSEGEDINE